MNDQRRHFFDKPENIRLILRTLYIVCTGLFVLDFILHRHVAHSWENLPGFYAIYGFVGCVILVLIDKWMRTFLMRDEDYYDRRELEDGEGGNVDA
ncbi:MAG TPA: hypothetical protein VF268_09525 [Gammaproteobacteria bacterium]